VVAFRSDGKSALSPVSAFSIFSLVNVFSDRVSFKDMSNPLLLRAGFFGGDFRLCMCEGVSLLFFFSFVHLGSFPFGHRCGLFLFFNFPLRVFFLRSFHAIL